MKKLKKAAAILLILAMTLALAACGSNASGGSSGGDYAALGDYTVRMSHGCAQSHPIHLAALQMKEYIERESDGHLTMEIYPNGQIGGERESVEAVMNGTCELAYSRPEDVGGSEQYYSHWPYL